ncbi:glycosyltransferase family 2 protein [Rhodopila globiformis]|uniref:glycosyltransferase family 2 protein n=1 Tax=Rhodopila globiformis TaxID=1071 RepID=UPI00195A6376|nr:glycosyltransferase [Rhodopila globiformis]
MPTIGLCMIVRNEAHVIENCLNSMRPVIDFVLIEDTGSTDGTQDIVRRWLAANNLPGLVFEQPWQDFATNRTSALERLRQVAAIDYAFVMDADDLLILPEGFDAAAFRQSLALDHYFVSIRSGDHSYWRIQLVSNRKPYRYRGVLHEFIESPAGSSQGTVPGIAIRHGIHGARSRNPNKYRDDALVFEQALRTETDPFLVSRYTFYLGQSWRDAGRPERALDAYLKRAELGFWTEEIFVSLLNAARLMETLGHPADDILATYQRAHDASPRRAEALHGAARYCRVHGLNERGYRFVSPHDPANLATADGLFIENGIYDHALLDEHAVNTYWSGRYQESLALCCKLLGSDKLPADQRGRVAANARFALDKLPVPDGHADIRLFPNGDGVPPVPLAAPPVISPRAAGGRVSIITPTGNRAGFLRAVREVVLSQTYPDLEWLILDDGAEPIGGEAGFSAPGIHYQHTDARLSIGEKRNRLIERATGEFIVQFDDDDYYAPGYVRTMIETLKQRKADLINLRGWFLYDLRWDFFGYWDLEHRIGPHYRCDADGVALTVFDARMTATLAVNHLGYGFSYAFRRKVWDAVKFPDVNWSEDYLFSKAAAERFRIDGVRDRAGLCLHYLHPASTSRCFPQYQLPPFLASRMFPKSRPHEPDNPDPAPPAARRELVPDDAG